jgi:hypothetical protein
MKASEFSSILAAPIDNSQLLQSDWNRLISDYPYAASLYVLRALSQKETRGDGFEEILHDAAARTLSRSRLHVLVDGPLEIEPEWLDISKETSSFVEVENEPSSILEEEQAEADSPDTAIVETDSESSSILEEEPTEAESPETSIETPEENNQSVELKNEFGFAIIRLKAGKSKPKETSSTEAQPSDSASAGKRKAARGNQDAIIEKFLSAPPLLQPRLDFSDKKGPGPDLSRKSGKLKEEVVTENMAMIYIRQKNYPKAIATLHKLTLKIPEKSTYFAALIKNLENQN